MNEEEPELALKVRIGVTTGEALVSLDARPSEGEGLVAGDVVNTAARLQAAAPVDGILAGASTYRATAHVIEYREAEPAEAKGKSEAVPVWQALQARSRVGVDLSGAARTPLVGRGRELELELLLGVLARVRGERSPQLVTLIGVPGIGKSRLVQELFRAVEDDPTEIVFWRQGRSLPYGEGVSFWALAEMVKSQAGILETDGDEAAARKLRQAVVAVLPDAEDARWVERHLGPLAGLARGDELRGDRREEAFAAWRRFFEALAEQRPTVLVFDDLHWADDGLLDFVDHLVDWTAGVPLLVVCTARPELLARRPGWGGGKPNAATVSLAPLSDQETARLIAALLERSVLPAEVQATLLARAGGNPLFAEEFARLAAERSAGDVVEGPAVPESVQGIIAARLDLLPSAAKALLQDGAVLGKVFWLGAVAAIGGAERADVERRLHDLERRQLVHRERRPSVAGETQYAFSHLLVRDVAYGQIPRARRAEKHRLAADWIASLAADRLEDKAEMLAHHYLSALEFARAAGQDDAALREPARLALRAAGERAFALSSFGAAVRFFREASALWPLDDPERPRLLFLYGRALWLHVETGADVLREARDGLLAAGEVELAAEAEVILADLAWHEGVRDRAFEHLGRALALVEARETTPSRAYVLANASRLLMLAGANEDAIRLGKEALAMAEELGLDGLRAHALNNIGVARAAKGDRGGLDDIEASIALAERIVSLWDLGRGYINLASVTALYGDLRRSFELHEKGMGLAQRYSLGGAVRFLRGELPLDLYYRGDWDGALVAADEFVAEVEAGSPHYLEASARRTRASINLARSRQNEALADSERMLAVAREAKDPQVLHPAIAVHCRLLAEAGRGEQARAYADELLAIARDGNANLSWAFWIHELAFALDLLARPDDLLPVVASGQAIPSIWIEGAEAVAGRDFARAADLFAAGGSAPDEALARLRAAEMLVADGLPAEAQAELERALAFYRGVGAATYLLRGEALLARAV